jgi:hypothetical protein
LGRRTEAAWRSRIVGHAEVPPAELVPNPRKWRTHPADQQHALAGALGEVGWVQEVVVNKTRPATSSMGTSGSSSPWSARGRRCR